MLQLFHKTSWHDPNALYSIFEKIGVDEAKLSSKLCVDLAKMITYDEDTMDIDNLISIFTKLDYVCNMLHLAKYKKNIEKKMYKKFQKKHINILIFYLMK